VVGIEVGVGLKSALAGEEVVMVREGGVFETGELRAGNGLGVKRPRPAISLDRPLDWVPPLP
jgi:hypothetical protein